MKISKTVGEKKKEEKNFPNTFKFDFLCEEEGDRLSQTCSEKYASNDERFQCTECTMRTSWDYTE
jgi:hypothetical protein